MTLSPRGQPLRPSTEHQSGPVTSPDGLFWWDGERWQPLPPSDAPLNKSDRWCDQCNEFVPPHASWAPLLFSLVTNVIGAAVAVGIALIVRRSLVPQGQEYDLAIVGAGLALLLVLELLSSKVRFYCPICGSEFTRYGLREPSVEPIAYGRRGERSSGRTRPRRAARPRLWLLPVLLVEGIVALGVYGYFNPFPLINPPTTWQTPSDAQLQQWQAQVQLVEAVHHSGGFLGLFPSDQAVGLGSGFFIGPDTLITALHVVTVSQAANRWGVGSSWVTVSHQAVAEDVAALKGATAAEGAIFPLAGARPARGQHVWLLCATGVQNGVQVSEFSVAAQSVAATLNGSGGTTQYVQDEIAMTGGAAAPGCSGAPVVDGSGAVVGMADGGSCRVPGACQLDAVPSAVFAGWDSSSG